ncbi:MAG TPA: hypothetical protein VK938_09015 [Methylophilaceae bacterium]|jgi:hypothetical protein|nr:hypothetical protein [Methylophilaceae bacterium]
MRKTIRLLIALALVLVSFGAGTLYQWLLLHNQHPVEVKIINSTGQQVPHLVLTFNSQIKGLLEMPVLKSGESIKAKFYPISEGSFVLEAKMADGRTLTHSEGYVEAGYSFNLTITPTGIIRQH